MIEPGPAGYSDLCKDQADYTYQIDSVKDPGTTDTHYATGHSFYLIEIQDVGSDDCAQDPTYKGNGCRTVG